VPFKLNHELRGGHVHVAVFSGPDRDHLGKCGDLVMRKEEWLEFRISFQSGANERGYPGVIFEERVYPPQAATALIYPTSGRV